MKTLLTVLTCERDVDYLGPMIDSLEGARLMACLEATRISGVDERIIACDGKPPISRLPLGWQQVFLHDGRQRGNLASFLAILKLAQDKDAGQLIYFEDDVIVCRGAIDRMLKLGVPGGAAFVTYFDMKEVWRGAPPGLYEVPADGVDGAGFWGMQAVVFPRTTINFLLAAELDKSGMKNHCDVLMSKALVKAGPPTQKFLVHVPCLVEHVGETSAIWNWAENWLSYDVNRRAMNFPGVTFDAAKI